MTLEGADYLHRDPNTSRFEIGPVAEQLVYAAFEQFQIRAAIAPYLRQIATSAQATTSLTVRIGWYGVTLALIESGSNIVSRARRLGRAAVLNRDAGGLAILAWLTLDEVTRFAAYAANQSPHSSDAIAVEAKRLATIRAAGFATSASNNKQRHALGIPLRDDEGRPVGSITVEAQVGRKVALQDDPRLKEWLDMVGAGGNDVARDAGNFRFSLRISRFRSYRFLRSLAALHLPTFGLTCQFSFSCNYYLNARKSVFDLTYGE